MGNEYHTKYFNDLSKVWFYDITTKSAWCCLGITHTYKKQSFTINPAMAEDTSCFPHNLVKEKIVWVFLHILATAEDNSDVPPYPTNDPIVLAILAPPLQRQ